MIRLIIVALCACLFSGCLSHHRGPLPGEPKRASFQQIGDTRVHYVDRGKGPPVVLIHGFASSLNNWRGVMDALDDDHRVIALDLKGFGWTDRPEGDYSPAAQADLVLGLMDALEVPRAALVGHSWGASVALAVALRAPARVSRLALYGAWVFEEQLPTTLLWAQADGMGELLFGLFYDERPDDKIAVAFYDERNVTEELVESVEEQLARPGTTAAALAAVRGQRYEAMAERYREIDQPTLLLWGREDRVARLSFGERLSGALPNAELIVYPRCGHFPMIEAALASTRDLKAFLGEDRPPDPSAPVITPEPPPAPAPPAAPAPVPTPAEPDDVSTPYDNGAE